MNPLLKYALTIHNKSIFNTTTHTKKMKGNITEGMNSNRILSAGQITELPFSIRSPFSIFLHSKPDTPYKSVVILNCQYYAGNDHVDSPFNTNGWNSALLIEISDDPINQTILEYFDIYWGSGNEVII